MRRLFLGLLSAAGLTTSVAAQDTTAYVIGAAGEHVPLSAKALYRAIGDRIVSGGDEFGNSRFNWKQADPTLPDARIMFAIGRTRDESLLRALVQHGCTISGESVDACDAVGIREDVLDRDGTAWQGATFLPGMAQFEIFLEYSSTPEREYSVPQMSRTVTSGGQTQIFTAHRATAPTTMIMPEPVMEVAPFPDQVYAARLFLGRNSFPPEAFAAYGILAFDTLATASEEPRYRAICEAFFSALLNSDDIAADVSAQMVTVWPIDDRHDPDLTAALNTTREGTESCASAVTYYDVQVALDAISDARAAGISLTGRGPFLIAWAPAGMKGAPDAIVLAADLGNIQTAQEAKDELRIWRDNIERDPSLWETGFTVEKLRVKLRQIVNRYGESLLRFLGG